MGILDLILGKVKGSKNTLADKTVKCPNCDKDTALAQERCSHCGVHIKSMFRKRCPKCSEGNELDAERCTKCKYDFAVEIASAKRTTYVCPICSYEADYYMLRCPACGAKFA